MKPIKVSVIVAVYKDIEALKLIVASMRQQTYRNFELVIAEDNNSLKLKKYVEHINDIDVKHTSQKDKGIQKMRSLNNGILASTGEYLVFIDGDCIPYSTFIESHVKLSEGGYIISGRRVNLGPKYSAKLRSGKIFLLQYPLIALDSQEGHSEAGLYFSPDGFIYKNFIQTQEVKP